MDGKRNRLHISVQTVLVVLLQAAHAVYFRATIRARPLCDFGSPFRQRFNGIFHFHFIFAFNAVRDSSHKTSWLFQRVNRLYSILPREQNESH